MLRAELARRLQALWYGGSPAYLALLPLSWLYCAAVAARRAAYRRGLFGSSRLDCPVIVVGNLVAGGSGKTPLVAALAGILQNAGWRVGLVCGGYRGRARRWPQRVAPHSDPSLTGDEAVLLAQLTGLPVIAGRDRVAAGRALLADGDCNLLLFDDGLQHYALRRDVEIAAIDAARGRGNGACLPAGPLREPWRRLRQVDAVVAVGGAHRDATTVVHTTIDSAVSLHAPHRRQPLAAFAGRPVYAVAGIADPERFFAQLRAAGLEVETRAFDDHHDFRAGDFAQAGSKPVLMTGKDAVKCRRLPLSDAWVVPLEISLEPEFERWLTGALTRGH